jgi:outer membrane lipoprotein LolB
MNRTFFNKTSSSLKLLALLLLLLTVTSCSVTNSKKTFPLIKQTQSERILSLTALSTWQINGKIAFLDAGNRNSANLMWQVNKDQNSQHLNLTSYLGINVLKLESNQGLHTLTLDNNTYQSDNLNNLIYSLTGLTLPTEALHFWLKGLAYQQTDTIIYNDLTGLPNTLLSQHNQKKWQIKYQDYQQVNQFTLPTKITINQGDLVIKIVIKTWSVFPH